ncbi:NAD(P)-dependent dehydrogenase, short-chain alcohol dehydrogenase family [Pseudoxanthobacter soli DSM 19599]|uniref:NAD(P)-dependent dehydrogenase, short-chain alcohol dehydrogenase family n=1 Tax=Pseudoxanthobacter soli DSM 19599 TaxID=1123029 RepID=A0A1M7ZLI4_9HYPH|nr:3-ketoacyl-ACP reductase [Pseudoxanthobacter soli]SHO65760.1 NAD(P)-dependent dehydrogenase, short-chain alcohol dehydrogenase family [Pseudoxanthobacter soli DSM 19599]
MHGIAENGIADLPPQNVRRGTALVTGGRRGIGRAICLALARRGFDIAFVDWVEDGNVDETLSLLATTGRNARFLPLDISLTNQHEAVIAQFADELGPINCLVNNAGIQVSVRGDMLDVDEAEFDRLVGVNLRGTFFMTQAVARRMIAAPAAGSERSIITITSANAHLVSPEKAAYCISKAGLSMAMQTFAVRLAEAGVRVHEIRPGLIETDMTAEVYDRYSPGIRSGDLCALRRWGEPDDIAMAIAMLATGGMPYSTGDIYNIGGGLQIPRL